MCICKQYPTESKTYGRCSSQTEFTTKKTQEHTVPITFVFHTKLNNLLHTSKTLAWTVYLAPPKKQLYCWIIRLSSFIQRTFWGVLYVPESGPYENILVCCMYQNQGPTNILWCVVCTRIRAPRTFCGVLYVPESEPHEHPGDMGKKIHAVGC